MTLARSTQSRARRCENATLRRRGSESGRASWSNIDSKPPIDPSVATRARQRSPTSNTGLDTDADDADALLTVPDACVALAAGARVIRLADFPVDAALALGHALLRCAAPPTVFGFELRRDPTGRIGHTMAEALARCAHAATSIELGVDDLDDVGLARLAPTLTHCSKLYARVAGDSADFNLERRRPDHVLPVLNLTLRCCAASLEYLDLSWRRLGDVGVAELTPSLAACVRLRQLFLSGTGMGNEGFAALVRSVGAHPTLRWLDVCGNDVGDSGVDALAPMLRAFRPALHLDLSKNRITDAGAGSLSSGILCGAWTRVRICGMDVEGSWCASERDDLEGLDVRMALNPVGAAGRHAVAAARLAMATWGAARQGALAVIAARDQAPRRGSWRGTATTPS